MAEKSPPCVFCGKRLHRRMDNGPAKLSDSFAWCRNQKCKKYNIPQAETRFKSIPQVTIGIDPDFEKKQEEKINDLIKTIVGAPAPEPEPEEPKVVIEARARIRTSLTLLEQTYSRSFIGLAMAIVAQELGSFEIADAVITEHQIDKIYGIRKGKR